MRRLLLASLVLALPLTAHAQEPRTVDRAFVAVAGTLAATTIFDVETTFAALDRGGTHEGNPIMRPVVERGRPATYAVLAGANAGILYAAYRMKRSDNPALRRVWWLLPAVASAAHGTAGGFNLRFTWGGK